MFQGRKRKDAGSPQLCLHVACMLVSQHFGGAEGVSLDQAQLYGRVTYDSPTKCCKSIQIKVSPTDLLFDGL